jgi:hypothetical protein
MEAVADVARLHCRWLVLFIASLRRATCRDVGDDGRALRSSVATAVRSFVNGRIAFWD